MLPYIRKKVFPHFSPLPIVSSFLCKFILGISGLLLPVFIQGLGYPVCDTVTTSFISKDTTTIGLVCRLISLMALSKMLVVLIFFQR